MTKIEEENFEQQRKEYLKYIHSQPPIENPICPQVVNKNLKEKDDSMKEQTPSDQKKKAIKNLAKYLAIEEIVFEVVPGSRRCVKVLFPSLKTMTSASRYSGFYRFTGDVHVPIVKIPFDEEIADETYRQLRLKAIEAAKQQISQEMAEQRVSEIENQGAKMTENEKKQLWDLRKRREISLETIVSKYNIDYKKFIEICRMEEEISISIESFTKNN